jgi:two-component system, NarL family, response regulator DevR
MPSQSRDRPIQLLIVDDHQIVRMGLQMLFKRSNDVHVVGEAANGAEALAEFTRLKPDVVLMDLRLPDQTGVEACRAIRELDKSARVLFLTSYKDDEAMFLAVLAGADGYLLKEIDGDSLLSAVRTVASGESILDSFAIHALMERLRTMSEQQPAGHPSSLSQQEGRVLAMISEGKTNREIAAVLGISDKTVKNYVSRVLQKLNVHRRTEAAVDFLRRSNRDE